MSNFNSQETNLCRKEILIVFSSVTIADPSDIFTTIQKVTEANIQVSVISLSSALFVLQNLCERTEGLFCLAKDRDDFSELLKRFQVASEKTSQLLQEKHEDVEI